MRGNSNFKSHFDELKNIKTHYLDNEEEVEEQNNLSRTKKRNTREVM